MSTKIEWCHETWNPITGCSPISEGCQNCYARRMANRLRGRYGYPKNEPFQITFHIDRLYQPNKWKKPRMIFVSSMGDLFHKEIDFDQIDIILREMFDISRHIYLILTKRPERLLEYHKYLEYENTDGSCKLDTSSWEWPKNIWLGVTAENQKRADERIPILLQIPDAIRFVSIEPMLGPIRLTDAYLYDYAWDRKENCFLDWVIAGPETGPKKRLCKSEWIRNLYEQCQEAGVPFFDKTKKNWLAREFPKNFKKNMQP